MVVHFIERLHVQLVILEGIGHAVVLPGRSDPESHDLSVPVDFMERAGGSPLCKSRMFCLALLVGEPDPLEILHTYYPTSNRYLRKILKL